MDNEQQGLLFSPEEMADLLIVDGEPETTAGKRPMWTDSKARFIALYLKYFVFITHHGTYIDGFAGPQEECPTDSWAAKLVLESKPQWLRKFHFCDANPAQIERLQDLVARQPKEDEAGRPINRSIALYHGDFNEKIDDVLATARITEKEATFCLLDQRTFECDWATVQKIARHKQAGNKIELFYFLANWWFERALSGLTRNVERSAQWWGRDDWTRLKDMSRERRCDIVVERLKTEFGYKSVKPYPIYKQEGRGGVMYYMIHATDHPEGPALMGRAYRNTVSPIGPFEDKQVPFEFIVYEKEPEWQRPFDGSASLSA